MKSFPIWRVLGVGVVLLLLALGLAGWLLSSRYGQRYVARQVRQQLTRNSDLVLAPFEVEFSIWHDFPHLTASLHHLALTDTAHHQAVRVLQVGRADLRLSLRELWHRQVRVTRLLLHDVAIEQRVDSLGHRWGLRGKQRPTVAQAPGIDLDADSVVVDNFRISSRNDYIHSAIEAHVQRGQFTAAIRKGVLEVQGQLLGELAQLRNRSGNLLANEPVQAWLHYRYTFVRREGEFYDTRATLNGDTIRISGTHRADTVAGPPRGNLLALRFEGAQPLQEVLHAVLPPAARPFLQGATSPSKAHISYQISGLSGPLVRPRIVLHFGLRGASIQWPDSARRIDRWDLQGTYDNGPAHLPQTMSVSLSECRIYSPVGELDMTLRLRDFRRPYVQGHLHGRTQLPELMALLAPSGRWRARQGTADVNFEVRGLLPAIGRRRAEYRKNMSVRGTATLHDAAFDLGGRNGLRHFNVRLGLHDSLWQLSNASAVLHGMRFRATATTLHLVDYFTGQYPTTNIRGTFEVDALDLGELRQLLRPKAKAATPVAAAPGPSTRARRQRMTATLGSSVIPPGMLLDVALRCGKLGLAADTLRDLSVRVRHDGQRVQLSNIRGRLWNGQVSGQAQWPTDSANRVVPVSYAVDFKFDTLGYRYLLGRLARPPRRSAKSPTSPAIRELLLAANGKLSYEIDKLLLPNHEVLRDLHLRFDKQGNLLSLPYLHFTDPQGGVGTGSARVQLEGLAIETADANLDLRYTTLDVPRLLRMLANAAPPRPDSAVMAARRAARAVRRAQRPGGSLMANGQFTARLRIEADKVRYAALDGTDFRVVSRLQAGEALLDDCTVNTLGGRITLRGRLLTNVGRQHHPLQAQLLLDDIQLPQLFGTLQGLKLNVLADDNIRGSLRCAAALRTDLDARFLPDLDQTVAYLRADLRKLELLDVEALQNAFKLLRKRTSHLYFEPVSSDFVLNRGELLIPGLRLNSNLTELEISGRYDLTGRANLFVGLNPRHALLGNNDKRAARIQAGEPVGQHDAKLTYINLSRDQPHSKYHVKLFQGKEHQQAQAALRRQCRQLIITQRLDTTLRLLPTMP